MQHENPLPLVFKARLQAVYDTKVFSSMRQMSAAGGMSDPFIQQALNGKFDNSKVGPGTFSMKRLADACGYPIGYFVGEDGPMEASRKALLNGTASTGVTADDFTEAHWRGGGRIEAFSHLLEYCDQYKVPPQGATHCEIIRLGRFTPFAMRMGNTDVKDAQTEIKNVPENERLEAVKFYQDVAVEGTKTKNVFLSHKMVTRASHVRAGGTRLGLHVSDMAGNQSILTYFKPIPV